MFPMYCTLEQVKQAINVVSPINNDAQIIRDIQAGAESIDGEMRRRFWPVTDTRKFDFLDHQWSLTWRLWLDSNELAAPPTQVLSGTSTAGVGGTDITAKVLARNGEGDSVVNAPFHYLEADLSTDAAFISNATYQQAIWVTGVFAGCPLVEVPGGTLTGLTDNVVTAATCSNSTLIGVGSLVHVDNERVQVSGKNFASTVLTLSGNLTATSANQQVGLGASGVVAAGETILIDAEQMLVIAQAGTSVVVRRAWNGTALAAHTSGAAVFVDRALTVVRGSAGTTAAAHATTVNATVYQAPPIIQTLNIAEALTALGLERAGYTQIIERASLTKVMVATDLRTRAEVRWQRRILTRTTSRWA